MREGRWEYSHRKRGNVGGHWPLDREREDGRVDCQRCLRECFEDGRGGRRVVPGLSGVRESYCQGERRKLREGGCVYCQGRGRAGGLTIGQQLNMMKHKALVIHRR